MGHFEAQLPSASKISMRHLYLYTHMLIAQANENGRKVRIVWGHKGLEEILSASTGAFSMSGGGYQPDNANEMQEQSLSKLGGSIANRASLRAGAQKTAAMLSLTFEDMIETVTKSETRRTTEGRLNTRSLWRYPLGEEKLFTKTTEGESIDTCFYLLGDESSSMDSKLGPAPGPRELDARITAHEACKRVSVAVGEVLHNLSIPVGIATYNTVVREWHAFDESWAGVGLSPRQQPRAGLFRSNRSCPRAGPVTEANQGQIPGGEKSLFG